MLENALAVEAGEVCPRLKSLKRDTCHLPHIKLVSIMISSSSFIVIIIAIGHRRLIQFSPSPSPSPCYYIT